MKIKVNRNYLWSEIFVRELQSNGVKYACISPGSRSTSLTLAFSKNKNIQCFVNVDERSGAFFALGLAKRSNTPVAVICTSGTAAAELYPAIIEAYQQRVPLIICTADRPFFLYNTGANQTINQIDIFKNHIRYFTDPGLPEMTKLAISKLINKTNKALDIAMFVDKGPVHINFPFDKPFEPDTYTDEIDKDLMGLTYKKSEDNIDYNPYELSDTKDIIRVHKLVKQFEKGLIIAGPDSYNSERLKCLIELSRILNYPVLADGLSQLRFSSQSGDSILTNYEEMFNNEDFIRKYKPQIILQFGRTPISKSLETYFNKIDVDRILINKYGDRFDPARKVKNIVALPPQQFCNELCNMLMDENFMRKPNSWFEVFYKAEVSIEKIKNKIINMAAFPAESRIINEVLEAVPYGSTVFVSNSLPVRDFDRFASKTPKDIKVFFNRGASGIDGIISTAAGISAAEGKPVYLITGDLAFYYDLTILAYLKKLNIPLIIVLINNNGGAIFNSLPIATIGNHVFEKYFITPQDLNFSNIIKGFGVQYSQIKAWENIAKKLVPKKVWKEPVVLEIKTDPKESANLRKHYREKVNVTLSKEINA